MNAAASTTPSTTAAGSDASGTTQVQGSEVVVSEKPAKLGVWKRFILTFKVIALHSWLNVLLLFVPIGIAAHFAHLPAGVVFAMNAIAIIPLAGLLSHSTEVIAASMGDAIGALMNVTFGNAVELIIL